MPNKTDAPHLPRSAPIEAYGKGGFVFAGMSHRGSLLCLPDAIWAWPVTRPEQIDMASLRRVFAAADGIDTLIIGTGTEVWLPPSELRDALRAQTRLWWIEQIIGLALALVCLGIIMRRRAFLGPAFWLTIYSTLFDVMRWIFEFIDGQVKIPVALILYLLFLWRLLLTRKQVDMRWDGTVAQAPPG